MLNWIVAHVEAYVSLCTLLSVIDRFVTDSATWSIDRQFMWGSQLLISPVLEQVRGMEGEKEKRNRKRV